LQDGALLYVGEWTKQGHGGRARNAGCTIAFLIKLPVISTIGGCSLDLRTGSSPGPAYMKTPLECAFTGVVVRSSCCFPTGAGVCALLGGKLADAWGALGRPCCLAGVVPRGAWLCAMAPMSLMNDGRSSWASELARPARRSALLAGDGSRPPARTDGSR